ncbi:amidase family protein [Rhizobium gallicum]|uniref:amidase family protein n=1 Tax=Rhizobium gallicum TaxID=56730 RepID=UPI00093D24E0|nr:amidase family protein [Rhizobium gallicum]
MLDVKGLPTTFGSEIFRKNIAANDDTLITAMRAAGATPNGKTNIPEWRAGGNTRNLVYGVTANPYDLSRSCAGSSGGSAVALACGYAPLATDSDTGGSLRNPASFCRIVDRPSPEVVPGDTRAMALLPLSTSGPMARNVPDCALMLSILARPDRSDPVTTVIDGRPFGIRQVLAICLGALAFTQDRSNGRLRFYAYRERRSAAFSQYSAPLGILFRRAR